MRRLRTVTPILPAETAVADGLAYTLWIAEQPQPPRGGVVILHGAGSCKESHHDFARAALPLGLCAIAFDARGHGESASPMDGRAADDVAAMATLLRERSGNPALPIALRGSSMGGYLALVAAAPAGAAAVVAICPAGAAGLRRALARAELRFEADIPAVDRLLAEHDEGEALAGLEVPVLLMHAEGDEQVPVQHSRELAERLRHPASRLIELPGGHHRSIQHDEELQAVSLRFIDQALSGGLSASRGARRPLGRRR
jgi:alpha-beta hydrolase superfamily lysophospholipase